MSFHKVFAPDLLEHLEKNSTGLHALNIITLRLNMLLLYKKCCEMPDSILEAKRAELPILNIELTMNATTSALQLGNHKKETDKWEGCDASKKICTKWKQAYLAAYARGINRKRVGATDEPVIQAANLVTVPATHDVMDTLAGSLDNLALAATSDRISIQQLMLANLSLMTSVVTLTAANKKFTKTVAPCNLAPKERGSGGGAWW